MDRRFPPQIHLQPFSEGCENVFRNETCNYFHLFVICLFGYFSRTKPDLISSYAHGIVPYILFNIHLICSNGNAQMYVLTHIYAHTYVQAHKYIVYIINVCPVLLIIYVVLPFTQLHSYWIHGFKQRSPKD
jgi:hypothetical protein